MNDGYFACKTCLEYVDAGYRRAARYFVQILKFTEWQQVEEFINGPEGKPYWYYLPDLELDAKDAFEFLVAKGYLT